MEISKPTVVVDGSKATVYAVVTPLAMTGKKGNVVVKPIVQFSLDGKSQKPGPTDESGLASIELDNLKIGDHAVIATVLGQNLPVSATADFEITGKTRTPTGTFGRTVMVLFFGSLLVFGPGRWTLTAVYLILTLGILFGIAWKKNRAPAAVIGNNDWVFPSVVAMFVLSAIMGFFNPLTPGTRWSATFSDSVFWGSVNWFFLGKVFTNMWGSTAFWYIPWCVPAWLISYSDDLKVRWDKHRAHGGGWLDFLVKEEVFELVINPIINSTLGKLLGIGGKK